MFLFFILLCSFLNDAFFRQCSTLSISYLFPSSSLTYGITSFLPSLLLNFPVPHSSPFTLIFQFICSSLISSHLPILPALLIFPVIELFFTLFYSAVSTSQIIHSPTPSYSSLFSQSILFLTSAFPQFLFLVSFYSSLIAQIGSRPSRITRVELRIATCVVCHTNSERALM
jgi:hypothetical protein